MFVFYYTPTSALTTNAKKYIVPHQPETQQHTDSNKTGITPTLLVLEVQDASRMVCEKSKLVKAYIVLIQFLIF
jgi:hypothetical protein